ncbi:hypothetical protein FB45DRAFT_157525 [Roridomyces roridus]|uniref:Protein kinase domain-containing protein n=1 Tax=Roridomyces roridus TaxID=1738132 RepID=A0AAD7BFB9_9AGAR|nr:hypothetical protein FB45DRAFT_157525 [Roridomyces roridus]
MPVESYIPNSHPVDLSNRQAVAEYHSQLVADRRAALLSGFTADLRFELDIAKPPRNPGARHPPALPSNALITFRLAEALQSGPGKHSQVWTAIAELPGGTPTTVVFKILQPSMCEYPEEADPYYWADYEFPGHLAEGEAWAYDHLAQKQGLLIPYFLGMRTIIAPSGERAWVLMLEYIAGGMSLRSYIQSPGRTLADTCNIRLSIETLTEFMADGWCNLDAVPRNVIVTGTPEARRILLIDLTYTVRLRAEEEEYQRVAARRKLFNDIYYALEDHTGELEQFMQTIGSQVRSRRPAPPRL